MTTAEAPIMTVEQRKAQIESDKADEIQKAIDRITKNAERKLEKIEGDAQEAALREKGVEFAQAIRQNAEDVLEALGIVVPVKGMKFALNIAHAESGNGLVISFENANKPRAVSTSTGTRAPRGAGTGAGVSINKIDGLTGFVLADGSEAKSASAVCQSLGFDFGSGSAAAYVVRQSLKDVEKANTVKAIVNGVQTPLGDLIVATFGKPAEVAA